MSRELQRTGESAPPEKRQQRISRLSGELRERALIGLINKEVGYAFAKALKEALESDDLKGKVPLLLAMIERVWPAVAGQAEQPTVAIQINNNLKRGRGEYA